MPTGLVPVNLQDVTDDVSTGEIVSGGRCEYMMPAVGAAVELCETCPNLTGKL